MSYSNRNISDSELDNLFRTAHLNEEAAPVFDPSFWSEMEMMLPEIESKRRKVGFWWWSLAGLFVFGLLGMYFYLPTVNQEISHQTLAGIEKGIALPMEFQTKNNSKVDLINKDENIHQTLKNDLYVQSNHSSLTKGKSKRFNTLQNETRLQFVEPIAKAETADYDYELSKNDKEDSERQELNARSVNDPTFKTITEPVNEAAKPGIWYGQFALTAGQSPMKAINGSRELVYGFSLGGGLHKIVQGMDLSAGLNLRYESIDNLSWNESTIYNGMNASKLVKVNHLFSFEMPLRLSIAGYKSRYGLNFTPGIQAFYIGNDKTTQNGVYQTSERTFGSVKHSSSLTMEIGLHYGYLITKNAELGLSVNMDILRPFNPQYYSGSQLTTPFNGQIYLRRFF